MTKPELGTKRLCAGCNAKFYDLHKNPIVCPMCETVFVVPKAAPAKPSRRTVEPMIAPVPVATAPEIEAEEAEIGGAEVETVELDDADEESDSDKQAEAGVPLLEKTSES